MGIPELPRNAKRTHGGQGLEVWLQVDGHAQDGIHARRLLSQALPIRKKTRLDKAALHPPDILTVGSRSEVETPTCYNNVVQELRRPVTELLLLAFTLRPGLFLPADAFSFRFDAFGFFLQAARAIRGDLGSPCLAAA